MIEKVRQEEIDAFISLLKIFLKIGLTARIATPPEINISVQETVKDEIKEKSFKESKMVLVFTVAIKDDEYVLLSDILKREILAVFERFGVYPEENGLQVYLPETSSNLCLKVALFYLSVFSESTQFIKEVKEIRL